ncbi:hypothetical protein GA0061094_3453 [[Bacillus] enclensis]|uniref:Uncharacterized protein n=1 Tax=[Bacillus] enclensis TaxID=1402860 RepID=A0A1C4D160_9BACI|nr:hypothetical protein GA0061094_3453 [[Bacillus] enclensis]
MGVGRCIPQLISVEGFAFRGLLVSLLGIRLRAEKRRRLAQPRQA